MQTPEATAGAYIMDLFHEWCATEIERLGAEVEAKLLPGEDPAEASLYIEYQQGHPPRVRRREETESES